MAGGKIVEAFSQSKDVLTIGIVTPGRRKCALEISAETVAAHITLRTEYHRKSKNSVDLFDGITSRTITAIVMDAYDRVVHIMLNEDEELVAELFGDVNVYHVDKEKKIRASFKNSKEWTGQMRKPVKSIHEDFSALKSQISSMEEFKIKISGGLAHFNKFLAMECLHTGDGIDEALKRMDRILQRLKTEKPRIYWSFDEPKLFSLIHLEHYSATHPQIREEIFESVNEAIQVYIARKVSFRQKEKKLLNVLRAIKLRIKKNRSLAESLEKEREEAEEFRLLEQKAHLLNLHIADMARGMESIIISNIYDEEQKPITIELNPEWPPQKNIEHYFSRSKKMKASINKIGERIHALQEEIVRFTDLRLEFEDDTKHDWKKIEKTYDEFVRTGWIKKIAEDTRTKLEREAPTFREFSVAGDWRVFVGQNDTKNDLLTFKFAKSDDYWFHARGVPGSHVVLKRDGRKDNPGKQAIEETASIAAYYSKGKSSSLVPVAYTLKKYVRKPKGFRPGQVAIEREEVVIVPPREPKDKKFID